MRAAVHPAGPAIRLPSLWRRLRTSNRRRRDLILPVLTLLLRSIGASILVLTLRAPKDMRRFIVGAILSVMLVWMIIISYLVLTPASYSSRWTFILPTSSSSSSVQVESIGHAQSTPSSPFGSSQLSPKVIYKEIISSERVRRAAAKRLDMPLGAFGSPIVKLIDETSLINIEMRGRSPEIARQKARALIEAFDAQLDALRRDEIRRRADVVKESLETYQNNLKAARERILEHQRQTGVLSMNQFSEASTSMELMRRKLGDVRADMHRLVAEQERLIANSGLDAPTAALLVKLAGEPSFTKLALDFADANSLYQTDGGRMGAANPYLALSRTKSATAYKELKHVARVVSGDNPAQLDKVLFLMNNTQRAEIVKALVFTQGQIAGKREELRTLEGEFQLLSDDVKRMSGAVARLEDLRKDHLVAEAVFTSALARLDTNKTDIYASYPMVQTLAAPDLADGKTSPYTLIAILAGILGSMLATAAWGMAWLGHMFGRKRWKKK